MNLATLPPVVKDKLRKNINRRYSSRDIFMSREFHHMLQSWLDTLANTLLAKAAGQNATQYPRFHICLESAPSGTYLMCGAPPACLYNNTIYIFLHHEMIKRIPPKDIEGKYVCICSLFAHELAHVLYSSFKVLGNMHMHLSKGQWYPRAPRVNGLDDRPITLHLKAMVASGYQMQIFTELEQYVFNILEDAYIENRFCKEFPGELSYYMRTHRAELAQKSNHSVEHLMACGGAACNYLPSILFQYALYGKFIVEDNATLSLKPVRAFIRIMSYVDSFMSEDDPAERAYLSLCIMSVLWHEILADETEQELQDLLDMLKSMLPSATTSAASGIEDMSPGASRGRSSGSDSGSSTADHNRQKTRQLLQQLLENAADGSNSSSDSSSSSAQSGSQQPSVSGKGSQKGSQSPSDANSAEAGQMGSGGNKNAQGGNHDASGVESASDDAGGGADAKGLEGEDAKTGTGGTESDTSPGDKSDFGQSEDGVNKDYKADGGEKADGADSTSGECGSDADKDSDGSVEEKPDSGDGNDAGSSDNASEDEEQGEEGTGSGSSAFDAQEEDTADSGNDGVDEDELLTNSLDGADGGNDTPRAYKLPDSQGGIPDTVYEQDKDYKYDFGAIAKDRIEKIVDSLRVNDAFTECEQDLERQLNQGLADFKASLSGKAAVHRGVEYTVRRGPYERDPVVEDSYTELMNRLAPLSRRMQRQVEQKLKDNRQGGKRTGLYSGKAIYTPALLQREDNDRLFYKNKLPAEMAEVCVGILVDMSGSMLGRRMDAAMAAASLLYDFCKALKLPVAVYGHRTFLAKNPNAVEGVELVSFADFKAADQFDKYRLMSMSAGGANRDGAAIAYMLDMLKKKPNDHKFLFVISDGRPNGNGYRGDIAKEDIKEQTRSAARKGVTTVAAAIGDDVQALQQIYDTCLDMRKLDELPKRLTGILVAAIKKNY